MSDTYTFTQVTRVNPGSGSIAGGQAVTITGFGFDFATGAVTFAGVAATSVSIVSNTSITCITPAHGVEEAVDVVVVGVGTGVGIYTYRNPATILLPRVPVERGTLELDRVGAAKFLMEVKRRIETAPIVGSGSVVGGAALTGVSDTNVTITLTGTPESALLRAVTLTMGWSGALTAARGGTGNTNYTTGDILQATSALVLGRLASVSAGSYLRSAGVATANVWSTLKLPNAANSGDILKASGADVYASAAPQALTRVNDTNVTLTLGGTPASALINAASLTLGWTGQLGLARGGTASDLSATGGTGRVLKQTSVGAAVTVATVAASEISSPGALTKTDDTNVTLTLGGSPTVALLAATSLTLGWTGTLSVARGGSGTATAFTAGSVVFAGASGVYTQDNANFFWDDTNNRLGLRTTSPASVLHVLGTTEQVRLAFDATNYTSFTNTSNGRLTVDALGSNAFIRFQTTGDGTGGLAFLTLQQGSTGGSVLVGAAAGGTTGSRLFINTNAGTSDGIAIVASDGTRTVNFQNASNIGSGVNGSMLYTQSSHPLAFSTANGSPKVLIDTTGRTGFGVTSPTAFVHVKAGTATANTAPLKFNSGTLLTSAEAGAVEFLTDDYYATITTGAARKGIVLNDGTALTSGRVPFATTNGRLTDDADLTFATDTLTATKLSAPTSVSTPLVNLGSNLALSSTTPTFTSGFGGATGRSISGTSFAFTITCGNNGTDTVGVLGLPTAATGWTVTLMNMTKANAGTASVILQTASGTASASIAQFDMAGAALAFANGDVLHGIAAAY